MVKDLNQEIREMPSHHPIHLFDDYDAWKKKALELSPSGYRLGLNHSLRDGAKYYDDTYHPKWIELYESLEMEDKDPITLWAMSRTGTKRWSEIQRPALPTIAERNAAAAIMQHAIKYGLQFGAVISTSINSKRSVLSVARNDREFTDEELLEISRHFDILLSLIGQKSINLSEVEMICVELSCQGLNGSDIARKRGTSAAAVSKALKSAQAKLGVTSKSEMIRAARAHGLVA